MSFAAQLRIEDDGSVSIEQEAGLSDVNVKAEPDATTVAVRAVRLVVTKAQVAVFYEDELRVGFAIGPGAS